MPLTPYQELAAGSRGGGRLVSAAAGSGKTMVLVERLMRHVDDGADIDDFLVVTYTRAAAGELRSRILKGLNDRIAADPASRRLRRQTELVSRAGIGTIDSLCGRFLRENAHLAGIAPDFKVAEQDRAETIRAAVMERVMEALYVSLPEDEGMRALVDSFGAGRDDRRLSELVLRLHAAVQSHPDPSRWLSEQTAALHAPPGTDAGETEWGKYLLSRTAAQAEYWAGRMEALLREMSLPVHEKLNACYADSVVETAASLRALAGAAAAGWEKVRQALPVVFPRPTRGYRGDDPLMERLKNTRDDCRAAMKKTGNVFAAGSEELLAERERSAPALEALLRLTMSLDRAYAAEKKRQGVVDFSDQEHMVLRLLEDEQNGLAAALSARYAEVLVDEYQDVNACQDRLFYHLSDHGRKLFMVGDVKQSIYRFRLADPTIFLDKYDRWPDVTPELPAGEPGRILLRENFRSRREVLEAANHVFRNIMSPALGEMRYDADAALVCGGELPPGGGAPIEMTVLTLPEGEEDGRPDKIALEAEFVAGQIRALVDGGAMVTGKDGLRRADWGDFAILLRSHKNAAVRYRAELEKLGIPAVAQQGGGFFRSLEVTVLLSLLSVIDNPRQDVPLIAALRSPLFGFTADDLAAVRARDKDADFYTALTLAAADSEKCAGFLRELEGYRSVAADLSVEALLGRICDRASLFALLSAMPDGAARRENVQLLMDYARQFELDGYRGVFPFVAWMRRLEQRGEEPRTGDTERRRAVQIISIHHSKGLEYPIVFLAGTGKKFNKQDTMAPVLIHPRLGVGGKVV
ncbi:MAG: UvrD-helicase domain-containing protein, partial [Oscillospiraceae bacterium]|nr:UvrD-helicase domain-containing protein [Oscillospiraceae bacterium]